MLFSKELHVLLKVAHKAHPELQVLLIDLMQYQPKLLVDEQHLAPQELEMRDEEAGDQDEGADIGPGIMGGGQAAG